MSKFKDYYLKESLDINDVKKAIKTLQMLIKKSKSKSKDGLAELPRKDWDKINQLNIPNNPPYIKKNFSPADAKIITDFQKLWDKVTYIGYDKQSDAIKRSTAKFYNSQGMYKGD